MIAVLINGIDVASVPSVTLAGGRLFAPLRAVVVRLADRVEVVDGTRVVISRGPHRLVVRISSREALCDGMAITLSSAPYRSGEDVMIPLHDIVRALHERLRFDPRHRVVTVSVPPRVFIATFTPAPKALVTPSEIFTPRPLKTPVVVSTPALYPRRTPIPVRLDQPIPPL